MTDEERNFGPHPEQLGEQVPRAEVVAPPLPIETHIVAAALMAERLRILAEQMTLILQHRPQDVATFTHIHDAGLTACCELDTHYGAYRALLECKGQA